MENSKNKLIIFEDKHIRRIWHKDEWWFAIVDVIEVLTGSARPRKYWSDLKVKLSNEEGGSEMSEKTGQSELSEKIGQLKLPSSDGKKYATDCANTEGIFRIIQSIPSPKAEPFKRWLAKVGYERVQEIEDPELATHRTRELYRAKGRSEEWIEKRIRSIQIREELTGEWDDRGIESKKDYAILTAEISKATFGMTPKEYKEHKSLKKENLRDHMTDLELIFSMLGESATTEITQVKDSEGFVELKEDAIDGGAIAGNARKELETKTGKTTISNQNYIEEENRAADKEIA